MVCMCVVQFNSQKTVTHMANFQCCFCTSLEPCAMMTAKIRMTTSTNSDVCFLLPRFSPIKEAICLLFPDLMFFLCFCVDREMSLGM